MHERPGFICEANMIYNTQLRDNPYQLCIGELLDDRIIPPILEIKQHYGIRYLRKFAKKCGGRRTTLHGAIRVE